LLLRTKRRSIHAHPTPKKASPHYFIVSVVVFISVALWFMYKWLMYRQVKFTRYPEFGITIPNNYTIHGIDVSRYQNIIAWEEVEDMQVGEVQLGFAFIKATEGIGNMDPQFSAQLEKSEK
jgi:lysozyme